MDESSMIFQEDVDRVVLKRLKFVLKIIRSLAPQPNSRNRQGHVYIMEVVDALGDWSGNPFPEMVDMLNKQLLPQIYRLISTFSRDEFNTFQQFFIKYILTKWEETSNFIVLDFLADIYGFIARICPNWVALELLQIFQQEEIPPHVSLIMFPSLLRNIAPEFVNEVDDRIRKTFGRLQVKNVISQHRVFLVRFWTSLRDRIQHPYHFTPVLHQCVMTSFFLGLLEDHELSKILHYLLEWSNTSTVTASSKEFLLISTIFLHSTYLNFEETGQNYTVAQNVLRETVIISKACGDKHIQNFTLKVLQRILELGSDDNAEVLNQFKQCTENEDGDSSVPKENNDLLETLEAFVDKVTNEGDVKEPEMKRIKLMIDSLQNVLDKSHSLSSIA